MRDGVDVARILRQLAIDIEAWGNLDTLSPIGQSLRDDNGNTVGEMTITPKSRR